MLSTFLQLASRQRAKKLRSLTALSLWVVVGLSCSSPASAATAGAILLKAEDAAKVVPATVFFRGQVASVQARNSAGVKLPDGMLILCALVDTSGYSTAVQQKYQAYFITEITIDVNGQTLKPGAYGVGFVADDKFLVMDLGAHDLFTVDSHRDAALKRPTPLQVLDDAVPNRFRLYINRNYIFFSPAAPR